MQLDAILDRVGRLGNVTGDDRSARAEGVSIRLDPHDIDDVDATTEGHRGAVGPIAREGRSLTIDRYVVDFSVRPLTVTAPSASQEPSPGESTVRG